LEGKEKKQTKMEVIISNLSRGITVLDNKFNEIRALKRVEMILIRHKIVWRTNNKIILEKRRLRNMKIMRNIEMLRRLLLIKIGFYSRSK
jgi:hypothetical protein